MDHERFDDLTRSFANGVSRRQGLKGLFGGAASLFVLTGRSTSGSVAAQAMEGTRQGGLPAPAEATCVDANPCERCDLDTAQCGLPCTDPCISVPLKQESSKNASYRKLGDYLYGQGFLLNGSPYALEVHTQGTTLLYLVVDFTKSSTGETASLWYVPSGTPGGLFGKDGVCQVMLVVDAKNKIQRIPMSGN